jgi:hypothetical protein
MRTHRELKRRQRRWASEAPRALASLGALAAVGLLALPAAHGQTADARRAAPIGLEGRWISVVTEDWRWRMTTPAKGDYASVPLNADGRRAADGWEPEEAGGSCLPYGAPALMRMPTRLDITWEDESTLLVRTDNGMQTRRLHFDAAAPPSESTRQGHSRARWDGSALEVVTTGLLPGYLRLNGVPYSASTEVTEYYNTHSAYGDEGFTVTTTVRDPAYLTDDFVTSSTFLKLPDDAHWDPVPCTEPAEAAATAG